MVSSNLHKLCRVIDLENLNSEKTWEPFKLYCRTKLANILFTRELNRRLQETGRTEVTVNALTPGVVRTGVTRNAKDIWYIRAYFAYAKIFNKVRPEILKLSL
jgi:NAD(P)-dependent dehydrogenase (short-subunit alcohol dehydrogenase family)